MGGLDKFLIVLLLFTVLSGVHAQNENYPCPNLTDPNALAADCPDADGDGIADKDDNCPTVEGTKANSGCPEPVICPVVIVPGASIHFDSCKTTIKEISLEALNDILNLLKEYPTSRFNINGHTDSLESKVNNNQKLSEERAASVRTWLINNGIDANRLTSQGFGESQPIATNRTRAGRAQNRRVEMVLVTTKEVIKN